MSVEYDIEFSGNSAVFSFDENDRYLNNLTITNTTTNNYQTAVLSTVGYPSASIIELGYRVDIDVNGEKIFQGDVARIQTSMVGERVDSYDLVGITSLLWQDIIIGT